MASVAAFVALGGGAYAASGALVSHTGTIYGCVYPKFGGDLHLVPAGKKCPSNARSITFNREGSPGAAGAAGAAGAPGAAGPQGPAGVTGQTRYGNILVAKGAADVLLAEVGHFQFWGRCTSGGSAETVKKTTTNGNSIYDEDNSFFGDFETTSEVVGDEDYDETGYARDNATGLTIQYLDYQFDPESADPEKCEFQGVITQTS